jgi:formate dehydrogenase iron-sulfur subunit
MHWMEPLVDIDGVGYGQVSADQVPSILKGEAKSIGQIEDHPFIAKQNRLTFARAGKTRPTSLDDYYASGGWLGLGQARAIGAEATIETIMASGLRGRGGAGFPAGIKWQTVANATADQKYIVCNADEGDSGTFADRMVMEGDPFMLIEGMAIAGFAVGASKAYIYIRSEYPHAIAKMEDAIRLSAHLIAPFVVEVRVGAGAYICGEETSLLNSLEGKRGEVRAKPPLPALEGLFGKPTIVNNVLTLAAVPWILAHGGEAYAAYGMGRSKGTMPVQLAGNVKHGGLFEVAFGITLGELVNDIGGGTASGRPVRCVQVGGPLGAYIPPAQFDLPFDYEAFAAADALIGHAGITVFDDSVDMAQMARFAMEFCAIESCGKCTPCRLGSTRGVETIDQIIAGKNVDANLALLADLAETMKFGSLCAMGGFTPYPVMSAIKLFPEDFNR